MMTPTGPKLLVTALALGILVAPLTATAQPPAKVFRIAWLGLASPGPEVLRIVEAFRGGLRDLGYVEGQNVAFEYRWAHGRSERLPHLAAELVRLKVDIIAVANTPGAVAASQATTTIPIVLAGPDPLSTGLIASLGRPGRNITGVTLYPGHEIVGKHLQLLKEAVPKISRLAVLWNPGVQLHALMLKEAEVPARSLGIRLQPVAARTSDEFDNAFSAMTRAGSNGLIVFADANTFLHRTRVADLAAKSHLPAMYQLTEHVEAGGLMAYSANFADVARRAATHVDKILKGAKPGDLPVELPTKFKLVVNLKTAKTLGLTLPQSILIRADEVIQ